MELGRHENRGVLHRLGGVFAATLLVVGFGLPMTVAAQRAELPTYNEANSANDPPGRVGRLSDVQGVVWLFHPEEGEWISAVRNRPVTSGDRLSTEPGARLELRIGSSSLRLDGGTDIEIDRLDDAAIDIHVRNGSVLARLRNDDAARDLLLATDDGSFTPLRAGSYRIDRRDGSSAFTVMAGQAAYNGPQSALTVYQGQRAVFWIDANRKAQYNLGQPQFDSFASWSGELDRLADRGRATNHVSPEMTGGDELAQYGGWSQDPEYGSLWTPTQVASDWAPYSTGHWVWVSPWGWSWVDDAPWGFAPFHYGRWVVVRDRWSWAPGRYVARPVYSPALVGWVGGAGGGASLTIGGGRGVGWFPLAPREAYVPAYRVSRDYMRGVNQPHFHNRADVERLIHTPSPLRGVEYSNRKFHHGTTAIPVEAFNWRGGEGRGHVSVEPNVRFNLPPAGNIDRLPTRALPDLPRPPWAGRRHEAGDRPGARDGAGQPREVGRPFEERTGSDDRRNGRADRRRGDDLGSAHQADSIRPPPLSTLPQSVQPPPTAQQPFVQPVEPRSDWPANRSRRGGSPAEVQQGQAAPTLAAPPIQIVAPVERSDQRIGRPDRGERRDRPFERNDQRAGRQQDQIVAPVAVQRPQQPAVTQAPAPAPAPAPPPALAPAPAPAPVAPPVVMQRPAMQAPPIRPPSEAAQPIGQGTRRTRDGREVQGQGAEQDRGGNVRDPRQGRNRQEQP